MPARKNRPGKHGATPPELARDRLLLLSSNAFWTPLTERLALEGRYLNRTRDSSYVGWPNMAEAEQLEKKGYLKEDPSVKGCFFLTDKFPSRWP